MRNFKDRYGVVHVAVQNRTYPTTLCEDPTKEWNFTPLYECVELIGTRGIVTCTMCLGYGSNDPGF